ncbi:neprilysin-4 [Anastrepha ludens]|uniref:neprilysin-4 n=1 Tax=Anastrepha ludens TaxID=28586 RepID=UPI0023B05F8A|nr:neprilysin-4 [Anastrepha ludens]
MRLKHSCRQWSATLKQQLQQKRSLRFQKLISITIHVLISALLTPMVCASPPRLLTTAGGSTATIDAHPLWTHVNRTCLAHTCNDTLNLQHLERLEGNIDWTVNACDDFHTHACGNWVPPRAHNTTASMMQVADQALTMRYVEFFESALNRSHTQWRGEASISAALNRATQRQEIRRARIRGARTSTHMARSSNNPLKLAANADASTHEFARRTEAEDYDLVLAKLLQYYRVCTRAESLTLRGYYEQIRMEGLLRPRHRHWQEMLAHFARYGYGEQFVYFKVRQQNATQHDITVLPHDTQKRLNLTAEIYDVLRAHTRKSHAELATAFRALEADVEAVVGTMCALTKDAPTTTSRSVTTTPVSAKPQALIDSPPTIVSAEEDCDLMETLSFAELTARCGEVDWQRFIGVPLGRHIHGADLIRVDSLETVCKLARYHNQAQHANINFLYSLARFLSYLQQQQYNPVRLGGSAATCIRHMRKTLSVAMTYVYDHVYYAPVRAESDRIVRTIFDQLKAEFAQTLALNRMQLDADIVAYLQQKLRSLRLNMGNLPPTVNSSFYVDLIWKLNVSSDNFYRNHLHALAHTYGHLRRLAASAAKNHSRSTWYTFNYHEPTFLDSLDSTPYYFCLSNMIIVPHAYLQTPFYDRQFWSILLYGDLANTLGHELVHSFDNTFLEYDHVGNMNELMMQRIFANVNFARNVQCLSQGTKFLAERIADVSGTRLALNTFLRDAHNVRRNGRLFFLQFAQFFCSNTDEATHQLLDPWHDADAVRLNYTLAQMPEFMEAFSCPAKSRMDAVQRCEMW